MLSKEDNSMQSDLRFIKKKNNASMEAKYGVQMENF